MDVSKNNIMQYLSATNTNFMIPVYQRNYDWDKTNCKQLFNDILYLSQDTPSSKTHFLGTICSKTQNSREKTIIDGQQRITSMTLLLKAIYDFVDDAGFKKYIDENFLHNSGYGVKPEHIVKLHLNKRDDAIYNKLLENNTFTQPDDISEDAANSHIYKNYAYFYECVCSLDFSQIENLVSSLVNIIIVDLDVEDENPQEIFESLNSTGLDLTDVDLLRNYLLMSLEYKDQVRLYDEYWFKIEQNVGTENMVRFFVDYLIYVKKSDAIMLRGRQAHINERNLYSAFRDYYHSLTDKAGLKTSSLEITEKVLKDMYERACVYKMLIFDYSTDLKQMSEMDQVIYSIVNLNGSKSSRPILLYIMEKFQKGQISEKETLEMLNACLSLVFRAKVSMKSGINGQFSGNVLQKLPDSDPSNVIDEFWKAITSGNGKYEFPSDKTFIEALTTRPIFEVLKQQSTKYLFYVLEQHLPCAKGLPEYNDANTTIEHIMPKILNNKWEQDLGEDVSYHDDFLNKLGNLALTSHNSEMKNRAFADKKQWYQNSGFYLTRTLTDSQSWTISAIRKRGNYLASKCVEIWSIPAKYQKEPLEYTGDTEKKKRFQFSMIGLLHGDKIAFTKDPSKIAEVCDDDIHVIYEGEIYSLSKLAAILSGNENSSYQGPAYFMYEGEVLSDMRDNADNNVF